MHIEPRRVDVVASTLAKGPGQCPGKQRLEGQVKAALLQPLEHANVERMTATATTRNR